MGLDAFLAAGGEVDVIEAEEAEGPVQHAVPEQIGIHAFEQNRFGGIAFVHACHAFHQIAHAHGDRVIPFRGRHQARDHHQRVDGGQCHGSGAAARSGTPARDHGPSAQPAEADDGEEYVIFGLVVAQGQHRGEDRQIPGQAEQGDTRTLAYLP